MREKKIGSKNENDEIEERKEREEHSGERET